VSTRRNNTPRITAAQQKVCEKLAAQATRLVNTVGDAVAVGVPPDDCYAMILHLLGGCQDPLPQDRHPAVTSALECIHSAMSALGRHMPT
jgi:hypothetical protein